MSLALLFAAAAAFVPVSAGHPILASSITTISDAARAAIEEGGSVSCRVSHHGLAMNVCLTADEWGAVLKDATEFEKRDRRRLEEWHSLTLRRIR